MLAADQDLAKQIVRDAAQELHLRWRGHDLDGPAQSELRPPAQQPLGIAEGGHPLRRVADRLVVVHLHHPLLVSGVSNDTIVEVCRLRPQIHCSSGAPPVPSHPSSAASGGCG